MSELPKKVRPGGYEYAGRLIVRTYKERPDGSFKMGWQWADYDAQGRLVIDESTVHRTLGDAIRSTGVDEEEGS